MKGFLAVFAADIAVAVAPATAAGHADAVAAAAAVVVAAAAAAVVAAAAAAAAENGIVTAAAAVADRLLVEVAHAEGLCCWQARHHLAGMCRQSSSCLVWPHT